MTKVDRIPWNIRNFQQIRGQLELACWIQSLMMRVEVVSEVECCFTWARPSFNSYFNKNRNIWFALIVDGQFPCVSPSYSDFCVYLRSSLGSGWSLSWIMWCRLPFAEWERVPSVRMGWRVLCPTARGSWVKEFWAAGNSPWHARLHHWWSP